MNLSQSALTKALRELEDDVGAPLLTQVLPDLIEGRLDFAIAVADPADLPYEIDFEPLGPAEAVLAAREGHPLAGATTWAELKDAKWVMNLSPGSLGRSLLTWLGEQGLPPPKHMIRCASTMLMLELMQRTDCIGIGPARLFEDRLVGHGIRCMHVTPLPPPMCFGILRLRGMPLSSAAKPMAKLFARYLAP